MNARTRTGLAALLIVGMAAALLSLALLMAVSSPPRPAGAPAAAAADPPHPGRALTPDEKAVERFLRGQTVTPEDLTVVKWGPHLTAAEAAGWGGTDGRFKWPPLYRVVYRGHSRQSGMVEQADALFTVKDGAAMLFAPAIAGDDWKTFYRNKVADR